MKHISIIFLTALLFIGCFDPLDITPPTFIPKSPPDSLEETGIDAYPENAIYLEWEEPGTVTEEGIQSYYIYRGKIINGEYEFKYLDEVVRSSGVIYRSDRYIDYDANLDTTYYYYIKSSNDFTVSSITSDTVKYKLATKAILIEPSGDIYSNLPKFDFRYYYSPNSRVSYFYLRLYFLEESGYKPALFTKTSFFDFSQYKYSVYLNNNSEHTIILYKNMEHNDDDLNVLEKGNYRWRIDAVSDEPGGGPETEGSESDWMYFTVK